MSDVCKVIGIMNGVQRMSRRKGVAHCPPGTRLFYIWNERTNLFYIECYVNEAYAIQKAAALTGPVSMSEVAEWWRSKPEYCYHSYKTKED